MGYYIDPAATAMLVMVTITSSCIHLFSLGYMAHDERQSRFFSFISLFTAAMLLMVIASNLLLFFMAWELMGLCSYLLIGFWYDKVYADPRQITPRQAAMKAFITTRVGDVLFMVGLAYLWTQAGSLDFGTGEGQIFNPEFLAHIGSTTNVLGITVATGIALLLFAGTVGKSAQFPLHVWLPDAMEGPTPVSALIHAATMVAAGVFLVARTYPIFVASGALPVVAFIGAFTALFAALIAVAQFDIKRILAYSTLSQLGFMVAALGIGGWVAAMFHLLMHAFFKALLFLGSGSVIHGTHDTQDMRKMGGLKDHMPTTWWTYMIGAGALAGIFPLAGFWSKDEILAQAFYVQVPLMGLLLIFASLITAFYMGRQIALIFYGKQRDNTYHAHESGSMMRLPLVVLAIGSILGGLINLPGLYWLSNFLNPVLHEEVAPFTIGQGVMATVVTLLAMGSMYGGWYLYAVTFQSRIKAGKDDPLHHYLGDIWRGAEIGWGFDWFYQRVVVRPYRQISAFLSSVFDQQGIDGILVDGLPQLLSRLSTTLRTGQSGFIRNYAWVFFFGVIVLVGYFVIR
jgi:NADH-quinone oxidoreductase subunit L